jgi:hypothetical protein
MENELIIDSFFSVIVPDEYVLFTISTCDEVTGMVCLDDAYLVEMWLKFVEVF